MENLTHFLSQETGVPRHNGVPIQAPLKPLNTIEWQDERGLSGGPSIGPPWCRETGSRDFFSHPGTKRGTLARQIIQHETDGPFRTNRSKKRDIIQTYTMHFYISLFYGLLKRTVNPIAVMPQTFIKTRYYSNLYNAFLQHTSKYYLRDF